MYIEVFRIHVNEGIDSEFVQKIVFSAAYISSTLAKNILMYNIDCAW